MLHHISVFFLAGFVTILFGRTIAVSSGGNLEM
jgi:hypothetical protein